MPFVNARLKPQERLVRVVIQDRPTYARAYAIIDIGDGEFDLIYQAAGTAANSDYSPGVEVDSVGWESIIFHAELYDRRMSGPRISASRREWTDETEALLALADLADKWPEVDEYVDVFRDGTGPSDAPEP